LRENSFVWRLIRPPVYADSRSMTRNQKGFTLIELMITVLIVGILVSVAIPVYVNASSDSRTASCRTNLRIIDGALQSYVSDNHGDPDSLDDLVPAYMGEIPRCPVSPGGHAYSVLGDTDVDPPLQSRVECGDNNGRGGVQDSEHFAD
jgi:prepilin-type N-terminal cleavage/methylation domain-containing protein